MRRHGVRCSRSSRSMKGRPRKQSLGRMSLGLSVRFRRGSGALQFARPERQTDSAALGRTRGKTCRRSNTAAERSQLSAKPIHGMTLQPIAHHFGGNLTRIAERLRLRLDDSCRPLHARPNGVQASSRSSTPPILPTQLSRSSSTIIRRMCPRRPTRGRFKIRVKSGHKGMLESKSLPKQRLGAAAPEPPLAMPSAICLGCPVMVPPTVARGLCVFNKIGDRVGAGLAPFRLVTSLYTYLELTPGRQPRGGG
jgi:hypothetical protein